MKRTLLFSMLAIFCCGCNSQNANNKLTLIPAEDIAKRVLAKNFNYIYAQFKNQDGSDLSDAQKVLLNAGKMGKDYYEDATGMIKEIRIRPITTEDKFIDIQVQELSSNPMKKIRKLDVDCNDLNKLYTEVYYADRDVRTNAGNIAATDKENQQKVVSAITKCGWTEEHLQAIWLIIQHGTSGLQAYYYPTLKKYAHGGKMKLSNLANLEDRMLLRHGYQQIYGTQVIDGRLQALENPDQVNELRATMGLGSIEEYLSHFSLDFQTEKKRMQNSNN